MILRLCAVLTLMLSWSCSGDDKAAEEPVKPAEESKIPDSPGEPAPAPAEAPAETAAEPPAAVEKSTSPGEVKEIGTPGGGEMTVTAGALNVRSGAGMKNGVVRVLKKGEKVATQGCAKGWCKLGEGEFASAKYLQ